MTTGFFFPLCDLLPGFPSGSVGVGTSTSSFFVPLCIIRSSHPHSLKMFLNDRDGPFPLFDVRVLSTGLGACFTSSCGGSVFATTHSALAVSPTTLQQ